MPNPISIQDHIRYDVDQRLLSENIYLAGLESGSAIDGQCTIQTLTYDGLELLWDLHRARQTMALYNEAPIFDGYSLENLALALEESEIGELLIEKHTLVKEVLRRANSESFV